MVKIKNEKEIAAMRAAGKLTYETIMYVGAFVVPGVTTLELDRLAYDYVTSHGGRPSFLKLYGFPNSICASVDDQVVHGIPNDIPLREGQIVSIDFGACVDGFHGDMARTFAVGEIDKESERLNRVTQESFLAGCAEIKEGVNLQKVSAAIQNYCEARGFGVVYSLCGHGIGRKMHEDPSVPNVDSGTSIVLRAGMTLAIEPMITVGSPDVNMNGWDIRTKDGKNCSHFENTVLVTKTGYEILTKE